ncbi:PrgI family protein [Candidatus Uhrbacteria bacterium]|nr:PrgI family protein [Candidatus Uhrbacteria bacterium]
MPEKFVVPQFLDNEDKILGPITVRQFLIMMGATLILFIEYKVLYFGYFIAAAVLTVGIASVFAFLKINGQPFHIFFINFLQTVLRPPLRVWHKELTDLELKLFINTKVEEAPAPLFTKTHPVSTHLRDLALTVNTGGVYNADDE